MILRKLTIQARLGLLKALFFSSAVWSQSSAQDEIVSGQLLALGRNMYSKGLDQSDELEADRRDVALAARAGFDPYGLLAVLQQLRTAALGDALFALSMSTHPPAQLRLNQLELAMGNRLDAYSGQAAFTIAQRMQRLAASPGQSNSQAAVPRAATVPKKN